MNDHYYSVEFPNIHNIYFTDSAVDEFVCTVPLGANVDHIVLQLNEAYNNGFKDGQNSSLLDQHKN